ncbi:GspH/FimT family pseudopilin [Hydrogenophaga bisanensis]|uniref:Type II secretion system protein H n=1 Tax=Hydrogenophaga bisanensis TaxID=439611 RepID=A0ABW2R4Q6_9BURK
MQPVSHPDASLNCKGFTLIEMMVVVSLLGILVAVGVPSFRAMILQNRVTAVTNELVAALQFARSESIRTGANVMVCSTNDQATCSGVWTNGWVVRNAGGPLRVWPPAREGVAIAVPGTVTYTPLGNVTAARCFQLTLDVYQRFVGVSAGGRVATSANACP